MIPRFVGNAVFLLTSDVVNRAATFVLYALTARYLGAAEVGQLALALAFFYALQVFAAAGVKTVITRQIARDRTAAGSAVASGIALVVIASALSVGALAVIVRVLQYSAETAAVVLLLGVALLPYGLCSVCEAVFQACDRVRYIAYAQVPVHIARIGLAYLLLTRGYRLYELTMSIVAAHCAVALGEWSLLLRHVTRPRLESVPGIVASTRAMARSASTFLGIEGLVAINAITGVVLLSALRTEREVGLYSAASQLFVPVTLVYQSTVVSIFPTLCRRFDRGPADVTRVLETALAVLLALAVPTTVGFIFLADPVLLLLYRDAEFLSASPVLRILALALVPSALTAVLGQVFLASVRERMTLRIVAVNTVVGLASGAVLIGGFGLIGAAATAVLTKAVDFLQHYIPVSKIVPAIRLRQVTWRPVVAVACMAAYLAWASSHGVILTAVYAGTLYLGVLMALAVWSAGGVRQLSR